MTRAGNAMEWSVWRAWRAATKGAVTFGGLCIAAWLAGCAQQGGPKVEPTSLPPQAPSALNLSRQQISTIIQNIPFIQRCNFRDRNAGGCDNIPVYVALDDQGNCIAWVNFKALLVHHHADPNIRRDISFLLTTYSATDVLANYSFQGEGIVVDSDSYQVWNFTSGSAQTSSWTIKATASDHTLDETGGIPFVLQVTYGANKAPCGTIDPVIGNSK